MTDFDSQTDCPLCSSNSISLLGEETMICDECSYVFDRDTQPVETGSNVETISANSDCRDEEQNWIEEISIKDSSDEVLVDIITDTESLVDSLGGDGDDRLHAVGMVVEAWQQQYFKGRTAKTVIAAAVYLSFRKREKPRPLGVAANAADVSKKRLRGEIRTFQQTTNRGTAIATPEDYLSYLGTQLPIDSETIAKSRQLLSSSDGITGDPAAIAGAAIYLADQSREKKITLAEVGEAAGVTKETIWTKKRELLNSTGGENENEMR